MFTANCSQYTSGVIGISSSDGVCCTTALPAPMQADAKSGNLAQQAHRGDASRLGYMLRGKLVEAVIAKLGGAESEGDDQVHVVQSLCEHRHWKGLYIFMDYD